MDEEYAQNVRIGPGQDLSPNDCPTDQKGKYDGENQDQGIEHACESKFSYNRTNPLREISSAVVFIWSIPHLSRLARGWHSIAPSPRADTHMEVQCGRTCSPKQGCLHHFLIIPVGPENIPHPEKHLLHLSQKQI